MIYYIYNHINYSSSMTPLLWNSPN